MRCRAIEIRITKMNINTGRQTGPSWRSQDLCRECFERIMRQHNNPELTRLYVQEGIARSYMAALGMWTDCALEILLEIVRSQPFLIIDDVWPVFEMRYPSICCMKKWDAVGGVMQAAGSGPGAVMFNTGRTKESTRPRTHGKPQRIWQSRLCPAGPGDFESYMAGSRFRIEIQ